MAQLVCGVRFGQTLLTAARLMNSVSWLLRYETRAPVGRPGSFAAHGSIEGQRAVLPNRSRNGVSCRASRPLASP